MKTDMAKKPYLEAPSGNASLEEQNWRLDFIKETAKEASTFVNKSWNHLQRCRV